MTPATRKRCMDVVEAVLSTGSAVDRILTDPEGGVVVYLWSPNEARRMASFDCDDDGILLVLEDRDVGKTVEISHVYESGEAAPGLTEAVRRAIAWVNRVEVVVGPPEEEES